MKHKWMLSVNLVMMTVIFILNYFYQSNGFDFVLKCICSGSFALLGIVNLCYAFMTKQKDKKFYIGMVMGLLLAFLGDVLIKYDFIVGAATFALGHVSFVLAYCLMQKPKRLDWLISGGLFLGCLLFLLFCPLLTFEVPVFRVVCIVYAGIISVMLGKSVGNFIGKKNAVTATIAAASMLFFFSDLMLVFDWFIGLWDWTSNACMGTYYPALCLLAFSMWIKTKIYPEIDGVVTKNFFESGEVK